MKEEKVKIITVFKASDERTFSGHDDSKKRAEEHQKELNKRNKGRREFETKLNEFDTFMRELFGIETEHDPDDWPDEEMEFCEKIMADVPICAEDGDFREEISRFFLSLYAFVGPEKWLEIHDFIASEDEI